MRFWLTWLVLIALLSLAIRRGGQPERIAAAAYVGTSLIWLVARPIIVSSTFKDFDPLVFAIDLVLFVVLMRIATRANRWWPLCASALQLIVLIAHGIKLAQIQGMAGVYWGMTTLPVYVQFGVLLAGIQNHAKRIKSLGRYPDWL